MKNIEWHERLLHFTQVHVAELINNRTSRKSVFHRRESVDMVAGADPETDR